MGLPDGLTSFDITANGDVLELLYALPAGATPRVFHVRSSDQGATWSTPVRVDQGAETPHHPHQGNGPQIAAHGEHLLALWTTEGTSFMGRGPMVSAVSHDSGSSWEPGPLPSEMPDRGGQAFIDIVADAAGTYHVIWLGKRPDTPQNKGLYYASSSDHGESWSEVRAIDSETCECCWNRLHLGQDGSLYAIYRDIDPRDMAVASLEIGDEDWRRLGSAGDFDWHFDGCPHVGGGVLSFGQGTDKTLHSIVWTGQEKSAGVHYVRSRDGGVTWDEPQQVGSADAIRPDIAGSPRGDLLLTWDEAGAVYLKASSDSGRRWTGSLRLSAQGRTAESSTLVPVTSGYRAFWYETNEEITTLMTRFLPLADLLEG